MKSGSSNTFSTSSTDAVLDASFDVPEALAERGFSADREQTHVGRTQVDTIRAAFADTGRDGVRGAYVYGPPGRGKTLMAGVIFDALACEKRRVHFHEFQRDIGRLLVSVPTGSTDRMSAALTEWLGATRYLWFEEFHVHDIADALILARLVEFLASHRIFLLVTSNYRPDGLLPDPELHPRFVPTIERIERTFAVIELDAQIDYRQAPASSNASGEGGKNGSTLLSAAELADATTHRDLSAVFASFEDAPPQPQRIELRYRPLQVAGAGKSAVWCNFDEMCVASRSYLDYLDVAGRYDTILLDRLHVARLREPFVVQRLIWLVDIVYDRELNLFLSSDAPVLPALEQSAKNLIDVGRVISRLTQIFSRTSLPVR